MFFFYMGHYYKSLCIVILFQLPSLSLMEVNCWLGEHEKSISVINPPIAKPYTSRFLRLLRASTHTNLIFFKIQCPAEMEKTFVKLNRC